MSEEERERRTDEEAHVRVQGANFGERGDEKVDALAVHEARDAHDVDCERF